MVNDLPDVQRLLTKVLAQNDALQSGLFQNLATMKAEQNSETGFKKFQTYLNQHYRN